ncbi:DUF4395 family protein [Azonexus sp.]|uniref:DUF4395 family protein n=1 Tax=Azonexus sp. TaxID=1872668 RepID=UPI0028289EB8|nr:DUF4395 family protein [Azonexus sp.]MDR1995876.1 DUF4395 domain-containing protein [Azonexus sp.]
MLRFDIPQVCSNAYRLQAAMSFAIAALYLFTPYRWVSLLLVLGGFLRGFVSPHYCLSYRLFSGITSKLGLGKMQNAGSKMFSDKIAFVAGMVMVASWLLDSEIGMIPAAAILIFSLLKILTGFCVACWAYTLWYRLRSA